MSLNHTVENVYLRQDAAQLTRRHFWRLLGMSVIVYALTAVLQYLLTQLGDLLMVPETQALVSAAQTYMQSQTLTSSGPVAEAALQLFTSPKFLLFNLLYIVGSGVVSAGMTLGHTMQLIDTGRGGMPKVLGVFSRIRYCLKAWGLNLWVALKTLLWMLPGFLMFMTGAVMSAAETGDIANWLLTLGMGLIFGLAIPAGFRYVMSRFILADEPDRSIRECVTLSKSWMEGRKWQYFKLSIPVILKIIGVSFAVSMLSSVVIGMLGLVENYLAYEVLTVIITVSTVYFELQIVLLPALFYLKRREPVPTKPVSYWLRKDEPAQEASPEATEDAPAPTAPEIAAKENENDQADC